MADTTTPQDIRAAERAGDVEGAFIPQTVTPPEKPLPFLPGLITMVQNPLRVWPRAMYERPYHGISWAGHVHHYVRHPDHMRGIFLDHADSFRKSHLQKRILGPAVGDGLLSSQGEHWRFQRRAASPAFRMDALRALVPAFVTAGQAAADRMLAAEKGRPVNMLSEMQHATLDVIVETLLGGADPDFAFARMEKLVEDYFETLGHPSVMDILGIPPWVPRLGNGRGRRAATGLKQAADRAIARHRGGQTHARKDLLGHLMAARDPETSRGLSDIELRDNVVTFIGAGHETTALTLAYTLYLIAGAPDVQDRLLEEAMRVCGDRPVDADAIDQLTFHEQVIKEAMRLYPPVALIDRVATEDVDLGDVTFRKDDMIFALVYVMHRHKLWWERPEAFDPDRFSEERSEGRHRFQFMPFGAGPRICIGMKFAYMEAVAVLATLVRQVRFKPNWTHKVEPAIRITLRPLGGMPLYVEKR